MEWRGGCLCGGTRYVITKEPHSLGNCHCIDCRRASGAAFVNWGTVPTADLILERGTLRKIPHADRVRSFASCCGTPLFFEESMDAAEVDVAIASLDDPASFPPAKNIWIEDKLPWVQLDPALPSFSQNSGRQS